MVDLIPGFIAESSEPVVLGYSFTVLRMDAKDGADTTAFDGRSEMLRCSDCQRGFDDLTGLIFAGHHQPLRVWILCLYFMGLNLSNSQIA